MSPRRITSLILKILFGSVTVAKKPKKKFDPLYKRRGGHIYKFDPLSVCRGGQIKFYRKFHCSCLC